MYSVCLPAFAFWFKGRTLILPFASMRISLHKAFRDFCQARSCSSRILYCALHPTPVWFVQPKPKQMYSVCLPAFACWFKVRTLILPFASVGISFHQSFHNFCEAGSCCYRRSLWAYPRPNLTSFTAHKRLRCIRTVKPYHYWRRRFALCFCRRSFCNPIFQAKK